MPKLLVALVTLDVNKLDEEIMNSLEMNDEMDFVQMDADEMKNDDQIDDSEALAFLRGGKQNHVEDIEMEDEDDTDDEPMKMNTTSLRKISSNDIAANADDYDFGGI